MLRSSTRQHRFARWLDGSWQLLALPMILFIALPILALIASATQLDLFANLDERQVIQAVSLSLVTTLCTTLVTLVFGTPVAYLLSRRQFRYSHVIDTLIDLPTVLPPSVAGIALLMAFGRRGLLGAWIAAAGIQIPFTMLAVIMAQTFIAAPFYVKAAAIGFGGIDPELKHAAALDGAGRWQILRYIVLPLSWTALLSGSVMTWARALGEFGATIIFAGNFPGRTQTMPLAIYIGFEIDLNVALTLAIILIFFSFLTLLIVKGFLHRRLDPGLETNNGF
ncbi:MAG: ABC transporter permease [Anaerolineaceae bacterium]|nr:ABC transporter permease [Anaerolineaceae bacterium]